MVAIISPTSPLHKCTQLWNGNTNQVLCVWYTAVGAYYKIARRTIGKLMKVSRAPKVHWLSRGNKVFGVLLIIQKNYCSRNCWKKSQLAVTERSQNEQWITDVGDMAPLCTIEGKLAEAVWWSGQRFIWKPGVLHSYGCDLTCTTCLSIISCQ